MTLQQIKENGEFICNVSHLNRMCKKIAENPAQVYTIIMGYNGQADSVTRESIFSYIADKYFNGDYDQVYNKWIKN